MASGEEALQMVHPEPSTVTLPGATLKLPTQLVLNLPTGPDATACSWHGLHPEEEQSGEIHITSL